MSQKEIRHRSGFRRVPSFINWLWLKAASPKVWTITMVFIYSALLTGWIPGLIHPPSSLEGAIGTVLIYAIGVLIVIGSSVGIFAAYFGVPKVERWTILSAAIGVLMYWFIIQGLHWTSPTGNRLPQAQTVIALIPAFVLRFVQVTNPDNVHPEMLIEQDTDDKI